MRMGRTFVEKVLNADAGSIVCSEPDIVLSHDNSARVRKLFEKIRGKNILRPENLVVVLDRKMMGTVDELIRDYNSIHNFMDEQRVERFFDCDKGICHQVLAEFVKPGMIITGSDSHTCTAGAFNCFAVGLNKTETAVLWKTGKMWFRVPETIKITLNHALTEGVYAKDLALWIMGMLKDKNAEYQAIEYHGEGVRSLSVADRMTVANVSAEMGIKNSVFPPDDILADYFDDYAVQGVWADESSVYCRELEIDLDQIIPVVLSTDNDNQIKTVAECEGIEIQQGLIGACSCGRLEDLRVVADILKGRKIADGFQLSVVPASREIYLKAVDEGIIDILFKAGVSILGASCGPCQGSSHMILANTKCFVTTTNSNSMRRMTAVGVNKLIASPATVARVALSGKITVENNDLAGKYPYRPINSAPEIVEEYDNRHTENVWNYGDIDNISCEQLFAEHLIDRVPMEDSVTILPHLLNKLDQTFADQVGAGDVIIAGWDFGCGKLIKHGAIGLVKAGVKVVIARSVNRNFFRMASNHGLFVLIAPRIVEAYKPGTNIQISDDYDKVYLNDAEYSLPQFAAEYIEMIRRGGIVNIFT